MTRYVVTYQETRFFRVEVEAEDEDAAIETAIAQAQDVPETIPEQPGGCLDQFEAEPVAP